MSYFASAIARGTRAAQPDATTVIVGALYFVTDQLVLERSNGTIWEDVSAAGGGFAVVRCASSSNINIGLAIDTLSGTYDGVSLVLGDLVLVKDQTDPAENGIYVAGPGPTRVARFDTYNEHPGAFISVQEGTNAGSVWVCTSTQGGTLGTTAIDFVRVLTTDGLTPVAGTAFVNDGNSGTAITIDWDHLAFGRHKLTLTGNVTVGFSNPADGGDYVVLVNSGAGGFTATFDTADVSWPNSTAPVITTTASRIDAIRFVFDAMTGKYYGTFAQNYRTDDGLEGLRAFLARPMRNREFLPLRTGWIAHQAMTHVAAPFAPNMVSDARPQRNCQTLAPKTPSVVAPIM
jgi:hypothetical protein